MTFVIPFVNRGDLDIKRAKANIDIYSSLNEKITSIFTNEIETNTGERGEIFAEFDVSNLQSGPYRAVATFIYDESTINLEKEFLIGKKKLELQDIKVNDFSLGEIAKFEILVENKWSEPIKGAYAQMQIYNKEGAVMSDFKSPTYDVAPLAKTLMISFWDTIGVKEGDYNSRLFLRYGQNSEQHDLKLEVQDRSINIVGIGYVISESTRKSSNYTLTILIILIATLVMINAAWFMFIRKKLAKKQEFNK